MKLKHFIWILCPAFLSVGAKNFEEGLTIDGPLYAAIARNIARRGEWFRLIAGVPDFVPFAEHPHLGFWLLALIFKVLPAADWSARILGHLCYVGSLSLLFFWISRRSGEMLATISVLLLWVWPVFSNFHSNVFLDPPLLLFGLGALLLLDLALEKQNISCALLAGLFLGLAVLTKGLAFLGFGPACAFLVLTKRSQTGALLAALCLSALILVVGLYALALRQSEVPHFLNLYWERQWSGRFDGVYSFANLFEGEFWRRLFRDTHGMIAILPVVPFLKGVRLKELAMPFVLFLTFLFLYAPALRWGHQYWITLMPWIAWILAAGIAPYLKLEASKLQSSTKILAIVAVALIQYLPLSPHQAKPPAFRETLYRLRNDKGVSHWIVDSAKKEFHFVDAALYVWYGDVSIAYAEGEIPRPQKGVGYLVLKGSGPSVELENAGWCLESRFGPKSFWVACEA